MHLAFILLVAHSEEARPGGLLLADLFAMLLSVFLAQLKKKYRTLVFIPAF